MSIPEFAPGTMCRALLQLALKKCRDNVFGSDNSCEGYSMNDLAKIAEQLRAIRARESEFLGRFAAESLFDRPIFLDGVLADLERNTVTDCSRGDVRAFGPEHPER